MTDKALVAVVLFLAQPLDPWRVERGAGVADGLVALLAAEACIGRGRANYCTGRMQGRPLDGRKERHMDRPTEPER